MGKHIISNYNFVRINDYADNIEYYESDNEFIYELCYHSNTINIYPDFNKTHKYRNIYVDEFISIINWKKDIEEISLLDYNNSKDFNPFEFIDIDQFNTKYLGLCSEFTYKYFHKKFEEITIYLTDLSQPIPSLKNLSNDNFDKIIFMGCGTEEDENFLELVRNCTQDKNYKNISYQSLFSNKTYFID